MPKKLMVRNKSLNDRIRIKYIFYSIIGYTLFVSVNLLALVLVIPAYLISIIFDRRDKSPVLWVIKVAAKFFHFINPIQRNIIDYNGIKAPRKGERRIYVVNHGSIFDVILIFHLPGLVRGLMKKSYTKIPIVGQLALIAGNIVLPENADVGDHLNIYFSIKEILERGYPVVIFPEGTRSKTGKIGRFYKGTFKIAYDCKADIVPVVFDTWNVIRPGAYWIRDVRMFIKLLDPIKYDSFKNISQKELSDLVRYRITKELINIRNLRRKKEKTYYRHYEKFVEDDREMEAKLHKLVVN